MKTALDILTIYFIIGWVFFLAGLLTGIWPAMRKDPELSEIAGYKLLAFIFFFTVNGWPVFVYRAFQKAWRALGFSSHK